eukprot:TRINITY_DN18755_c0_g1_i2.p1 TRINITY_DN18755_c0_g1~~TRINITY_DN18755_c0_g1_i2.p1  ORF type:complete len:211 (-),score=63.61 TRINITY_DN18755_c0_g1_i2:202-834(-)
MILFFYFMYYYSISFLLDLFLCVFFFFFFKQKTAYEMLRSLVGSEMCIRDSQPSMESLKALPSIFGGQYLLLCIALLFISQSPLPTIGGALAIYCLVDAATQQRALLEPHVPESLRPQLDKLVANKLSILANATVCELGALLLAPLIGGISIMLVMFQLLRARYKTDQVTRLTFGQLGQMAGKVFYHPRCPPVIGNAFTSLKGILLKLVA